MKRFTVLVLTLDMYLGVFAWPTPGDTSKYRISLKDKAATDHSLQKPEKYLPIKSIERRKKQGLPIDSTDLSICRKYVDAIRKVGVHVLVTGKWDNFITVFCNDNTLIDEVTKLPLVYSTEKVQKGITQRASQGDSLTDKSMCTDSLYNPAIIRAIMSRADLLYDIGFKGQRMTIAVIDARFHNVDKIGAVKNIHILGVCDFVDPEADIYVESSHEISILSCMAMNQPHAMTGTAPGASYWLLRNEDEYSKSLVERDYRVAAIEFTDSVGVDLVNTSLGYYSLDGPAKNYRYRDLDGYYALMSRETAKIADKGMVVVCNAGDSSTGSWEKIAPPGDTENIIAVGAVDKRGELVPFSSVGSTADGRVKPDVVAVGLNSGVMGTDDSLRCVNEISLSSSIMCGIVACLWQTYPKLTAKQIIDLVRQSGDRVDSPGNIYGYGVLDLWKVYLNFSSGEKK